MDGARIDWRCGGCGQLFVSTAAQNRVTRHATQCVHPPRIRTRGRILIAPRERTLSVGSAAEIAYESTLVVDFVTGPADYLSVVGHEIVFEFEDRLYACRLESVPSEYDADRKVFESMCESVRVASTP